MLIAVCEDQKNDRQLLLEYLNTELELSLIHILSDEEIKEYYAKKEPYGEWLDSNLVTLQELKIPNEKIPSYTKEERARLQKSFGYTYEEYREGICAMALNGTEQIGACLLYTSS